MPLPNDLLYLYVAVALTLGTCAVVLFRRRRRPEVPEVTISTLPTPFWEVEDEDDQLPLLWCGLSPPVDKNLWRFHAMGPKARLLPTSFLIKLVPEAHEAAMYRLESDHMAELSNSISQYGILVPLTIVFDHGRIALLDGNHRIAVARRHGIDELPVVLQRSRQIKKHAVPIGDLIEIVYLP